MHPVLTQCNYPLWRVRRVRACAVTKCRLWRVANCSPRVRSGEVSFMTCCKLQSPRVRSGEVSFMTCLPDELLLYIFSLLSHKDLARCVQVCQHFKRVASDLSLCESQTTTLSAICKLVIVNLCTDVSKHQNLVLIKNISLRIADVSITVIFQILNVVLCAILSCAFLSRANDRSATQPHSNGCRFVGDRAQAAA